MKMNKDKLNTTLTTLYVGDLHPDVTEPVLLEKFVPVGGVHSIKLYRDKATGFSRGYAYVNFYQRADAERAFELLNYDLLMGQPMRIMWFQVDSSLRNAGTGNIFINNLDKSINSLELHGLFSTFGKILSCKIVGYKKGYKRYAYVHFESVDAAERAIKALNGKLLNDRLVTIEHFKSFNARQAESAHNPKVFTNIFIKYFDQDMDTKKLTEIFSKFGPVASARVMTNEQGRSKRFGFVRFERPEDAEKAVEEMNGKEVNGKKIYVNRAQSKEQRQAEFKHKYGQGLNLYVKNLEPHVDDECLRKEFSRFGHIINTKVMMRNGCSRKFGFVHFSSPKDGMNAIKEMDGRMWGKKPLYVTVAQRKEECQAYLAQQHMQWMASMEAQNTAAYYTSNHMVPHEIMLPQSPAEDPGPEHAPAAVQIQRPSSAEDACPNLVPVEVVVLGSNTAEEVSREHAPPAVEVRGLGPAEHACPEHALVAAEVPGSTPAKNAGPEHAPPAVEMAGPASAEDAGPEHAPDVYL